MSRARRLPAGGSWIDRSRPVVIDVDGRRVEAFAGDTVASALLANGMDVAAHGIYSGRPRGIVGAGSEDPNGLVHVTWPDGSVDTMARATLVEVADGMRVESLAGRGRLEIGRERRFDKRFIHVEVLVIGAGRSGRASAEAAVAANPDDRVLLVDEGPAADPISGAQLLARATALGIYDHGYATIAERRPGRRTEARLWHVRADRIVIATGAIERPVVFPDNDRPGIMLAAAARSFLDRFAVVPGERAVLVTTNDGGIDAGGALEAAGVELVATLDTRAGTWPTGTEADADGRVNAVRLAGDRIPCDLVLVSGGWTPNLSVWSQARGRTRFDPTIGAPVPDGSVPGVQVVGRAAGIGLPSSGPAWRDDGEGRASYVDLERDATVADVREAVAAGLHSIEHIKRYTTIGTGSDQGKTSGVVASAIAETLLGAEPGSLGLPTFRAPYTPVSFELLAGRDRGALHDPVRTTAIHPWHVTHGAVFEDVGQWKRPRYFPIGDETLDEAVRRESATARRDVAVMDASTLGKIDLQGPDVGAFLDRIYTNTFSTLKVGACRYGVMCRADGMVFDDGVTSRLADDRWHMTTTTGNAATVLDWLEEWLQTEWPDLGVHATSVTEEWVTIAVVGPRSRDVLAALAPGLALDADAFPFMTWRAATVAGLDARVFRISFSGELAYEINVPAWYGLAMWEAVMAAGEPFGITPYGTETMHVLRAEKGYPIIGQETDGTVTPLDLGMGWAVSTKKSFIGRRSLQRADARRPDRKQLVALLPDDPAVVLPEGAQLVADPAAPIPMPMLGHVTSSYESVALGRSFALALLKGGRDRIGETVHAPLPGGTIGATIHDSVLFDPENRRRDGRARLVTIFDAPAPRSPLEGVPLPAVLREIPFRAQVDVRLDPLDGRAREAVESVVGALPVEPTTVAGGPDAAVLWLGPDEWLVFGPGAQGGSIETQLRAATAGARVSVVDVSANRTTLELTGPAARSILESGCSIDLDRRAFRAGRCAQTLLARANVILWQVADEPIAAYRLLVRPSFAAYVAAWIADAAEGVED